MANLIMIESKPTNNNKKQIFFQNIQQYFEGEGFSVIEDTMNNKILFYSLISISRVKMMKYIDTIKNTTNYSVSVKDIYMTINLMKV